MNSIVHEQSEPTSLSDSIESSYTQYILPVALFSIFALYLISPSKNSLQTTFYLSLLLPGIFLLSKHFNDLNRNKILVPVTLFLTYSAATSLWSDPYSLDGVWQATKNSLYIFIFIFCLSFLDHEKQTIPVLKLLVLIAAAASLYSIYDAFIINETQFGKRMMGTGNLDHPLRTSTVFGFFSVCNFFILMSEKDSHPLTKPLYSITLTLLLAGLICGVSRTPLASTIICTLALSFIHRNKAVLILLIGGAVTLLAALSAYPDFIATFTARGMSLRPAIWADALEHIKQAPIIGHGIRSEISITAINSDSAHSRYLSTLYYSGAIGLILFLFALGSAFIQRINTTPNTLNLFKTLLLYGCLCSITEGKFLVSRPDMVWLIIWLPLGLTLSEQIKLNTLDRKSVGLNHS